MALGAWEPLDQELATPHKSNPKDFSGRSLGVMLMITVLGLCSGDKGDCKLH